MGLEAISKCKYYAVLLTLIALHGALLIHGRQIKPINNQHSSVNPDTAGPKDNLQPALSPLHPNIDFPSLAENKAVSLKTPPKYHVSGFGDEVNAFRPTTPGNSPGVGHKRFAGQETKVQVVHSPDVDSVTEGFKDDFEPIGPGHSPGVGHVRENINGGPN